jgi:predicted CopG family antitoxin
MRTLNIPLEDKDYDDLLLAKGKDTSWRDFILNNCLKKQEKKDLLKTEFDFDKETSMENIL